MSLFDDLKGIVKDYDKELETHLSPTEDDDECDDDTRDDREESECDHWLDSGRGIV